MSNAFLILLAIQIVLGALDNLLHHELTEKLPTRTSAKREIALHGARELIYASIFLLLAWFEPHGLWAWALLALLIVELPITLADFIEEDRTRTLPPLERVLHTMLALNFGALIAAGAPAWSHWAATPTALEFKANGLVSWLLNACAFGVAAWGIRDVLAAMTLFARKRTPHEIKASGRTLLITGATGFLGEALVERCIKGGDRVIVLTRDTKRADALFGGRVLAVSDLDKIPEAMSIDGVVNLAGAGVANAPWTRGRKRVLLQSRLRITHALGQLMARLEEKPAVLVNASAVGFYGDRGEQELFDMTEAGAGFTADLCTQWEDAAAKAGANARRCVRLRFGLILGRDGGAWPSLAMSLPIKIAAQFGKGDQWMSWIHKADALGLIEAALVSERFSGPVNASAPQQVRHRDFVQAMSRGGGAYLVLTAPAWAVRAGFGEMAHLFLDSQRVVAQAALGAGYVFRFATIESAVSNLLGQPKSVRRALRASMRRARKMRCEEL